MNTPATPHLSADSHICAECSQQTGGCCRTDPAEVIYCFPLSTPELDRLLPHAHLADGYDAVMPPENAVSVAEPNTAEFLSAMKALFPHEQQQVTDLFPPKISDGSPALHFRIKTRADGSCVFLTPKGCCLPRQARPWYCLLFPAWVKKNTLSFFMSEVCLAARQASSPAEGAALVGMKPADAFALFKLLLHDWGMVRK